MTDYFDDYFFTSKETDHLCPNIPFECQPINACARDPHTKQRYCCNSENTTCWRGSSPCATDGSTLSCGSGDTSWCCLDKTEVCSKADGQVNVCESSVPSTLFNIKPSALNQTYLSLIFASPFATSWAFTPSELPTQTHTIATTSLNSPPVTTLGGSITSYSSTAYPTLITSTSSTDYPTSPTYLSAPISPGTITSIVLGTVALVVLIAGGLLFLLKGRNRQVDAPVDTPSDVPVQEADMFKSPPKIDPIYQLPYPVPPPSELHGGQDYYPQELPTYIITTSERYV